MIFKYALLGALSGFLSSTPLGPINLWVADHKLSRSPNARLWYFLAAVILVDITFATAALWGHFELLDETTEMRWAGILSGAFTALLGLLFFIKARAPLEIGPSLKKVNKWSSFLQGLLLTGANPAFLIFWLFVANQIMSRMDKILTVPEILTFALGVIAGDIIWFFSFTWILTHLGKRSQANTLKKIRMAVGIIFFLLGITGMGSYVFR
jgi:threonine/homoserine/homoserine lactone efflux protein